MFWIWREIYVKEPVFIFQAAEAETTYKACVAEANNRQADLQRIKTEHLAAIRDQILLSDQVIKKVSTCPGLGNEFNVFYAG